MATSTRTTVVGVFQDRYQAENAFAELRRAGFRDDQLGVVARDADVRESVSGTGTSTSNIEAGALAGAATGAGVGGLWGLGIAAGLLPAVGPVILGGTLIAILASAAGAAAVGGIVGALVGLGIPEDEARYYESEVHSGRILVTVKADTRYTEAASIMQRCGGTTEWRKPAMAAR